MHRRDFLKGSSAAALAVGTATAAAAQAAKAADDAKALATPALMPQRRTLRMVSLWPDAVTGPGDHVRRLAKRIEAASDGRLLIEITDQPATGADAFKAVMTGNADLYVGHEHAHRELHPAFSYFAGLPCRTGMDIDRFNAWLMAAGGQDLWDDLAAEFNMKGLMIGHSGRAHGLWTRHHLQTTADFKDKRIPAIGLACDVLRAVGAMAADQTSMHALAGLARGDIDGAEIFGTGDLAQITRSLGAGPAPTLFASLSINDAGYGVSLGMRRSLWDGLANSYRVMFAALASEARAMGNAETHSEAAMTAHMYEAAARHIVFAGHQQPYALARQLTRIAETIVADLSGHDDHARRINASYMAFKRPARSHPLA